MSDSTSIWTHIATAIGGGGFATALWKIFGSRARVEIAELSAETRRQEVHVREDSLRFKHEHGFAAEAFAEEREERQKVSAERNRLANENVVLIEEVTRISFENVALKDRVDALEGDVRGLKSEVRECHEGRADDMRRTAEWVRDLIAGRVTEPPRPRSVTPKDMPAILSANAVNTENKT